MRKRFVARVQTSLMEAKDTEIAALQDEVALLRGQLQAQGSEPPARFQPGFPLFCAQTSAAVPPPAPFVLCVATRACALRCLRLGSDVCPATALQQGRRDFNQSRQTPTGSPATSSRSRKYESLPRGCKSVAHCISPVSPRVSLLATKALMKLI